jgi:hypothetical protein
MLATNVGFAAVALDNTAVPPDGCDKMAHLNVSGWLSESVDPVPSSCTVATAVTVWFCPGLATGATSFVEIMTVDGWLFRKPSLTISCMTYVPGRSARNEGFAEVADTSAALLPLGFVVIDQL